MRPTNIAWRPSYGGNVYTSACGEERQGRATVMRYGDTWRWTLDMRPADPAEPAITCAAPCATAIEAMEAVCRQVDLWPVLIAGARR